MSQSQVSSQQSPKATRHSSSSKDESSGSNKQSEYTFQEVKLGSETFYLVPKYLMKYTPIEIEYLEGRGAVEVGKQYLYIPRNFLAEIELVINRSTDLQAEVNLCRQLLWSQYSNGDQLPPVEPSTVKEIYLSAGAIKLFKTIFHAMFSRDHSASRQALNKANCSSDLHAYFWPVTESKLVPKDHLIYCGFYWYQ